MDERIRTALDHGQVIDMTTTGRRSGLPRRIEIAFHNFDGRLYISGVPSHRKRAWLANLESDPGLTLHLKGAINVDLAAVARIIHDREERRAVLTEVARVWRRSDLDEMVAHSPLVEVCVDGYADRAPQSGDGPVGN